MLERDELKIAVEDARSRQSALVALIYFTDTQAMALLRCYLTIEAGAVSAIAAAAASSWDFRAALIGSAIGLLGGNVIGSYYCFKAMETADIVLPGRGPDFWLWGLDKEVAHDAVAVKYLQALEASMTTNREVNRRSASALNKAKIWGLCSPFVGIGGALVAMALLRINALSF